MRSNGGWSEEAAIREASERPVRATCWVYHTRRDATVARTRWLVFDTREQMFGFIASYQLNVFAVPPHGDLNWARRELAETMAEIRVGAVPPERQLARINECLYGIAPITWWGTGAALLAREHHDLPRERLVMQD